MRFEATFVWQGRHKARGFTLVELLVVIAITGILLALLIGPLVQGFNLTRRGQAQVEAQDVARLVLEQIDRELKRSAYVFDNTNRILNLWFPDNTITNDGDTNPDLYQVRFAVVDMILPAQGDPTETSSDPTSDAPRGELNFPLAPGRTAVRYFIGLQDNTSNGGYPLRPYVNGFEQMLIEADQGDNFFVLYRAEFTVYEKDNSGVWRVNTRLFTDANNDNIPDDFYDPNFFYGDHAAEWKKSARPLGALGRVDMVGLRFDQNRNLTEVTPLMQFRPSLVNGQTASPVETRALSDEMGDLIPLQMRVPHGVWTNNLQMVVYRSSPDAQNYGQPLRYFYTQFDPNTAHWWLRYARYVSGNRERDEAILDLTEFKTNLVNARSGMVTTLPLAPGLNVSDPTLELLAFYLDDERGMMDFPIPSTMRMPNQVAPVFATGNYYTPDNDPAPDRTTINGRFNDDIMNGDPNDVTNVHRYVSLIDMDFDGVVDPPATNPLTWSSATIVPNSEVVIGPDQMLGPNWGRPIRYRRVSHSGQEPGPNQYRINYDDHFTVTPTTPLYGRRGYIRFYSDRHTPLPPGRIEVSYSYQLNTARDTVVVDYETRSIMTLGLSIKLMDGASNSTNFYTLNTKIELPNLIELRGM